MTAVSSDRRAIITDALRRIDELTARLAVAEQGQFEPIAVVGVGCRLPGGADGPDRFWDLLCAGGSGIVRVPAGRWDADEYFSADTAVPGTICTREGGFLTGWEPAEFDAEFFGISPREAAAMDPQQRLLMEVAWEALEHAGITPDRIRGTQTSVFVGMTGYDYMLMLSDQLRRDQYDAYVPFGNALNFAAGRLSYFLGVRGPAVVVDTACSSSLVSVHLACQSLRRRESDTALAAGVNLLLKAEANIALSRWGMLAPDGQCKTFDAAADGYVRSEGCGVVVLKRLGDAQRDGDRILAVVRGSAVNQDGASSGQTVPNGPAQQALMRQALAASQLGPADVDYVEAHGTGTALGDPIELDALAAVFGERAGGAPLVLGSVKTNLGHLESGAGITGFIKTVLSVGHGYIPKHLNFTRLTPHAGQGASRFTIAVEGMAWPAVDRPRRAGVSSFGVSGTNAHIIIEQAPEPEPEPTTPLTQPDSPVHTLVVSGRSTKRIAATAGALADWMTESGRDVPLAEIAHTLNHHRARHSAFATVCAREHAQVVAGLRALSTGGAAAGVVAAHEGVCGSGTVFVFSGQGSQWAGMGRRLLAEEPAFAAAVDELEPVFVEQVGFSLRQVIAEGEPVAGDARVQPVVMGLQLALTALWRSHGVVPDAVIGHSMGEVTAAVVSGALSVREGLRVIATRSQLMSRLAGQGAVALLELDARTAESVITAHPGVELAGFVSPSQTVVAGPPVAVDAVIAAVTESGRFARRVNMEVASHTALMDPILDELRVALADLVPQTPSIRFYSTVDGTTSAPRLDADYWVANVRRPVRLHQAVSAAAADGHTLFVEVSPHPVLVHAIGDTLGDHHHHAVGTLARDTDDTLTFHTNLNTTHTTHPPQTPHPPEPHPQLPTTPWHHTRHWIEFAPRSAAQIATHRDSAAQAGGVIPAEWNCELTWMPSTTGDPVADLDASWLVIGDRALGDEIGRLMAAGHRVMVIPPSMLLGESGRRTLGAEISTATRVIYAPEVPSDPSDPAAARHVFEAARTLVTHLAASATPAQLFLLTRNAQPIAVGDRANPAHAVLWGLGRTLALEHPDIWGKVIDIDESVPDQRAARYLLAEADPSDDDDQVVYRAGTRHVPRLRPPADAQTKAAGRLDADVAHLVVGATGNIGPHLVQQLADMGARTVVAVSRNPGGRLDRLTASLAERGVTVVTVAADAADETAMAVLFDRFGADLPPLGGIYLAAFGGGPVMLTEMTDDDVTTMFRPKIDAAIVLHRLSVRQPVQQFVLFTSISGIIGSRWLAHYTATTTFLDTLAYARRAAGLPATAINWGFWKSLADNQSEEYRQVTLDSGLEPMPDEVAIQALWSVTGPDAPTRATVVAADWTRLGTAYRTRTALHIIDDLVTADADDTDTDDDWHGIAGITEMDAAAARQIVSDRLLARLAGVLGYTDHSALNVTAPLIEFGMDSLMAVRIRQAMKKDFGVEPPVGMLLQGGTLTDVIDDVMTQLGVDEPGPTVVDAFRAKTNQRAAARRDASLRRRKGQLL